MPTAIIFPGQASQTPGMRDQVALMRPELLERVAAVVGADPFDRADESTRYAQPAIFAASLAGYEALRQEDPVALAGHSLGELTALVAAGAIDEEEGLALVALRGRLMADTRRGTMLAALGGERAAVERVAGERGVTVANDNAPGQLVLSGEREAIAAAAGELRDAGVRTLELNVAGAFHSPLMEPAVTPFATALAAVDVREPAVPVWSCTTARPLESPDEVRAALAGGLTAPVRWRETVLELHERGVDRFLETGPGQVLTRLVRRTLPEVARV